MIHNTCIYGTVKDGSDTIITNTTVNMKYVKYDFSNVLEQDYDNQTGAYQFNLGDSNLLTLSEDTNKDDVVIISNDDTYSARIVFDGNNYYEHNIIDDGSLVQNSDEAQAQDESTNTIVKSIIMHELSSSLYTYFEVLFNDERVYGADTHRLIYTPKELGEHIIRQWSINDTTGVVSSIDTTIDVQQTGNEIQSIDYVFYSKRKKILRAELPQHVTDTLILAQDWYYEGGLLIGKHSKLGQLEMDYYNGKVIIKGYIGDIIDY